MHTVVATVPLVERGTGGKDGGCGGGDGGGGDGSPYNTPTVWMVVTCTGKVQWLACRGVCVGRMKTNVVVGRGVVKWMLFKHGRDVMERLMGGDGEVAVVGGGVDGSGVGEEARGECEEEGKEHVDSIVAVVLLQMDWGATLRTINRSISTRQHANGENQCDRWLVSLYLPGLQRA